LELYEKIEGYLKKSKIKSKKLKRSKLIAKQNKKGIMILKWKDKQDILMLSTKHSVETLNICKKKKLYLQETKSHC